MSLPEKIQRLDEQIAAAVRQAVQDMGEEMGRRLRESREEVEQRLSRLASSLPQSFVSQAAIEPLATAAATEARHAALSELRQAVAAIDHAGSQSEILNALLTEGGRFASRTALFLTRTEGAVGWGSFGFDDTEQAVRDLVLDYAGGGAWSQQATGRGSLVLTAADCAHLCSRIESQLPHDGVLVPLVLRDQLAATLYADRRDGDPEIALEALQTLTYVAAQALETQAFRHRQATPTLRLASEAAAEPALELWRPVAEPAAATPAAPPAVVTTPPAAEPEQVAPPAEPTAAEPTAAAEPAAVGAEAAPPPASADEVETPEAPSAPTPGDEEETVPPVVAESWSEGTEVAGQVTEPDSYFETVEEVEANEAPSTAGEVGHWRVEREDETAVEVGWASSPEPAGIVEETAGEEEIELATPEVEQGWGSVFDEDDTQSRPAPEAVSAGPEPSPTTLVEEPPPPGVADTATPYPGESGSSPVTEVEPPSVGEPASPFDLQAEPLAATEETPEPVGLSEEPAPMPGAAGGELLAALPEEEPPIPDEPWSGPAASPVPAGQPAPVLPVEGPTATVRLPVHDVSADETVLLRRSSLLEPPAEAAAAAPPPPASSATRPVSAHPDSAQVTPPSDVDGPGWAFATTRVPVSSEEETIHEEARRLARLLVSEIKLYNEDQVEDGRRNHDIYDRLKEDIDRSRQMYEERIDDRIRNSTDYFYQELVRILAAGDSKALGI
jgi:hypothetical protein